VEAQDLGSIRIKCGNCEKLTKQQIVANYTDIDIDTDQEEGYYNETRYLLQLSLCPSCDFINLTVENEDGTIHVLFPSPPKDLEGLPPSVGKAYKAARAVKRIDPNAFAVLLGRVVELVCLDRGAKGNTLNDQLQDLANRGEIPDKLAKMAHQLRALRNIGAHATLGELTYAESPILEDLGRAILEYVYIAPHLIKKVEQKINKLKKQK
jgi:hypothetical protein